MITPVIGKGPAAIEYAVEWFKRDPGGVLGSWWVAWIVMGSASTIFPYPFVCYFRLMATIGITFMMASHCSLRSEVRRPDATYTLSTDLQGNFATQATEYFSEFGYESTGLFAIVLSCIILSM